MHQKQGGRDSRDSLLSHWALPDLIKSPHAILNYLELLKLLEYNLCVRERTTWEDLSATFCIGGMFQNHTDESAFSEDHSTAGVQKNYPSEKEYRKSPYSREMQSIHHCSEEMQSCLYCKLLRSLLLYIQKNSIFLNTHKSTSGMRFHRRNCMNGSLPFPEKWSA